MQRVVSYPALVAILLLASCSTMVPAADKSVWFGPAMAASINVTVK